MFDVAEARRLLTRLREADRNFIVFGASSHRYEFEPRLPDPQLRTWEHEHGIELPAALACRRALKEHRHLRGPLVFCSMSGGLLGTVDTFLQ